LQPVGVEAVGGLVDVNIEDEQRERRGLRVLDVDDAPVIRREHLNLLVRVNVLGAVEVLGVAAPRLRRELRAVAPELDVPELVVIERQAVAHRRPPPACSAARRSIRRAIRRAHSSNGSESSTASIHS
jgi:hypothetical protein